MWPFHRHEYKFADKQHYQASINNAWTGKSLGGGPVTIATWKCECGKIKQKQFDGWLDEEVFADGP